MNQKEQRAIIKARGWRLRSARRRNSSERRWYIESENGVLVVSPRESLAFVLNWGIALITEDKSRQDNLRMIENLELLENNGTFARWRSEYENK